VDRSVDHRATEAERLSLQVMQDTSVLVDLGLLPIKDIPQLPKIALELQPMFALILKCLQEALASSADPWG
jgi:hypothetical protein